MSDDAVPMPPDVNRGPEILAVCGTMVGLALVAVVGRIWIRAAMVKRLGADDYVMIGAMTVMFAEMMVIIPQVQLGAGRHYQYIQPPENVVKGLHLNFVTQPLCLIGLCLTKVSIGLFLLRITPSKKFKWFIWGCIIFTCLSSTGNLLTVFFQCRPLAFTWNATIPGGKCIPPSHLKFAAFFNSSVSVLTDVVFALLPIPMLWNVQMNWKVKMAVAGVLSLGIFASAAAIVKITFLSSYGKYGDFLFDSSDLTIWTTIEICTAIIAACIPCFKPLFKAVLAGSSARYGSNRYKNSGYIRNQNSNKSNNTRDGASDGADDIQMYGRSGHNANIASGYRRSNADSEESIIPQQNPYKGEGITKITQVTVSVDESSQPSNPKSLV